MKKVFFFIVFLFILISHGLAQAKSDLAAGFQFLTDNNPEAAFASFNLAISSESQFLIEYAQFGIAKTLFYKKRHPEAIAALNRFIRDYKNSVLLEEANSILEKCYSLSRFRSDPKWLYEKGEEYFEKGDYEMASSLLGRLAREFPSHKLTAKAFLMLGRAELEQGDEESSIRDIEKSYKIATGSEQGRSLYYLGRAYGRRGRYPKAISAMSKVIEKYPQSSYVDDALYYLALYFEKTDNPQAALPTYLTLIVDYPKSPYTDDSILRAGHLYYEKGDFQNAYNVYSLAKRYAADDGTPQGLFLWGLMAEKLGKTDSAAGIYYYVADKYDHTYQSYRAKEKLKKLGYQQPKENILADKSLASLELDESNLDDVVAKWKNENPNLLNSSDISSRLVRYGKLLEIGLTDYAFLEAKELLSKTEGKTKESAQQSLAKIMQKAGNYSIPIRYSETKIHSAIWGGTASKIPFETWQLAYPKAFWEKVYNSSIKYGVDPYLTLAVIREESRFNPKALSRARAHGLMQIMPSTGRLLAKHLDLNFKNSKMYVPDINIELGTFYLADLIKRYKGNTALALASYNGGPTRVRRWLDNWYNGDATKLDIDEFVQNIPIRETRLYVQKVLGSYYEYKRIYNGR